MSLVVLEHALAGHLLARLRDETTPPERFRSLTRSLTQILVSEAARNLPTLPVTVKTPMEETSCPVLASEIVVAPVLRAGLGMLDATLEMLPEASVGYIGLERDEATAQARTYYCKLPDLTNRVVLLLDPMLATGGSAGWAAQKLYEAGAGQVMLLCIVAAPQGIAYLAEHFPHLHIVAASQDRDLNDRKYILPGLGDFGDRLYGTQ